jgi:hypothetical protein
LFDYYVPLYNRDESFYESDEDVEETDYSSTNMISQRITSRTDVVVETFSTSIIADLEEEVE